MDTAILDCGWNYRYYSEIMFPITNVSDATDESNCLSWSNKFNWIYCDCNWAGTSRTGMGLPMNGVSVMWKDSGGILSVGLLFLDALRCFHNMGVSMHLIPVLVSIKTQLTCISAHHTLTHVPRTLVEDLQSCIRSRMRSVGRHFWYLFMGCFCGCFCLHVSTALSL